MPCLVDGESSVAEVRGAGLEGEIAEVTGLAIATVRAKLRDAHGRTKLRNVFVQWPDRAGELACWTAAFARERDAAAEIAAITGLGVRAVRQRLQDIRGNTLVQNVFAAEWDDGSGTAAGTISESPSVHQSSVPERDPFPSIEPPALASIAPEPLEYAEIGEPSAMFRRYDLRRARETKRRRVPAAHQVEALAKLQEWYASRPAGKRGGVLALPTGGGKTFTAVRFLCQEPLSDGYKVLWLAHTHHLLEQAIDAFGPVDAGSDIPLEVAHIVEPRTNLDVRVVSATPGHFPLSKIECTDDVVIATLQTVAAAFHREHPKLMAFLDSCGDKLFVVFDEAHHAPAPSYRKLLEALRRSHPELFLLGLTATPTYSDERRQGWLKNLFPQDVLATVSRTTLIAAGILAKPHFEDARTGITVSFDEPSYQRWTASYGDLPEELVTMLAENQQRNDFIVETYLSGRERYGKTLIFADRWYQCDWLREGLRKRGVRADVVYSHVDAKGRTAEARNRRAKDDNARVLERFRGSDLEVLVNVRMLTEGTDVPSVQTVFLTRQTTSAILLTQMIGRALRGPKFGGTPDAHIVSFIDNWKQVISFADYQSLPVGQAGDTPTEYGKRPPLQLISIELVRRLARQMYKQGTGITDPFLRLLPVGWYRIEFETRETSGDDVVWARQLVMVFDSEKVRYDSFIEGLAKQDLTPYAAEALAVEPLRITLEAWRDEHFSQTQDHPGTDILLDLLQIARHMAQNDGEAPAFFEFEQRAEHDIEALAQLCIDKNLSILDIEDILRAEFVRVDRFWQSLYPNYALFDAQLQASKRRILDAKYHGQSSKSYRPKPTQGVPPREVPTRVKNAVLDRDHRRCCCCDSMKDLEIDHITPLYLEHSHEMDRLQTLCHTCNALKSINEINFRVTRSPLNGARSFEQLPVPTKGQEDEDTWRSYLQRAVNFFYRCAAVQTLEINDARSGARIRLWPDVDANWIAPHLDALVEWTNTARASAGLVPVAGLTIGDGDGD
jgi:ATP-dependent helicase IRC3